MYPIEKEILKMLVRNLTVIDKQVADHLDMHKDDVKQVISQLGDHGFETFMVTSPIPDTAAWTLCPVPQKLLMTMVEAFKE